MNAAAVAVRLCTALATFVAGTLAYYAFAPFTLVATGLVIYSLYSKNADFERRRRFATVGAVLAVLAGLGVVATDFDLLGVLGALISTLAAAAGGFVGACPELRQFAVRIVRTDRPATTTA